MGSNQAFGITSKSNITLLSWLTKHNWFFFTKLSIYTALMKLRSSLIHFACIGVAPSQLYTLRREQSRGATPMQAKWITLDLDETGRKHPTAQFLAKALAGYYHSLFLLRDYILILCC